MAFNMLNLRDFVQDDVCMFLDPRSWAELYSTHRDFTDQLELDRVQTMFGRQLLDNIAKAPGQQCEEEKTEESVHTIDQMLNLAAAVEVVAQVAQECARNRFLVARDFAPMRQALATLDRLAMAECNPTLGSVQMRLEGTGKKTPLVKLVFKKFALLGGLAHHLVALLSAFPARMMPADIFIKSCEVIAWLMHSSKDTKRAFVDADGLKVVLRYMRKNASNKEVQAGGLACLLALSKKSEAYIRLMVTRSAHEIVASSLHNFSADTEAFIRATGLLANMSNVPEVSALFHDCGVVVLAESLLQKVPDGSQAWRTNVEYVLQNLEDVSTSGY